VLHVESLVLLALQNLGHQLWRIQPFSQAVLLALPAAHVLFSLDYSDGICEGFYEVFGDFPEVEEKDTFPSLEALKRVRTAEGDFREVRGNLRALFVCC
jgi:hypothetical protein